MRCRSSLPPRASRSASPTGRWLGVEGDRVLLPPLQIQMSDQPPEHPGSGDTLQSLWPEWECDERDGDGWVAEVKQCLRGRATVRCVHAADDDGRAYEADLDCKVLRPV